MSGKRKHKRHTIEDAIRKVILKNGEPVAGQPLLYRDIGREIYRNEKQAAKAAGQVILKKIKSWLRKNYGLNIIAPPCTHPLYGKGRIFAGRETFKDDIDRELLLRTPADIARRLEMLDEYREYLPLNGRQYDALAKELDQTRRRLIAKKDELAAEEDSHTISENAWQRFAR